MKKLISLLVVGLLLVNDVPAQATGKVDYPYLGISFSIPDGWLGQEGDGVYVMGSNTEAGMILLSTHESKSLEALKAEARQGISEEGFSLQLSGEFEALGDRGVGAVFSGYADGIPCRAYSVGLINPLGNGVTIFALTSAEQYSPRYRELAREVARSVSFKKAETPPIVDEWRQTLQDCRLTYMDSYYSSGPSTSDGYSTGGGYSSEVVIDLCSQGYFRYTSNSSVSVDAGGAYGNAASEGDGSGTWEVTADAAGKPVLKLSFYNGERYEYTLSYEEEKTYLNGKRYFRTYRNSAPEHRPQCN